MNFGKWRRVRSCHKYILSVTITTPVPLTAQGFTVLLRGDKEMGENL